MVKIILMFKSCNAIELLIPYNIKHYFIFFHSSSSFYGLNGGITTSLEMKWLSILYWLAYGCWCPSHPRPTLPHMLCNLQPLKYKVICWKRELFSDFQVMFVVFITYDTCIIMRHKIYSCEFIHHSSCTFWTSIFNFIYRNDQKSICVTKSSYVL